MVNQISAIDRVRIVNAEMQSLVQKLESGDQVNVPEELVAGFRDRLIEAVDEIRNEGNEIVGSAIQSNERKKLTPKQKRELREADNNPNRYLEVLAEDEITLLRESFINLAKLVYAANLSKVSIFLSRIKEFKANFSQTRQFNTLNKEEVARIKQEFTELENQLLPLIGSLTEDQKVLVLQELSNARDGINNYIISKLQLGERLLGALRFRGNTLVETLGLDKAA